MPKTLNIGAARLSMINSLARHGEEQIPAQECGGILCLISGFEKENLLSTVDSWEMIREHCQPFLEVKSLLNLVPRRRFKSCDEICLWASNLAGIEEALTVVREWGFCSEAIAPTAAVQVNAFIVKSLEILANHENGEIKRDCMIDLLACFGMTPGEVRTAVDVAKGYSIGGKNVGNLSPQ